jgi:DNA-binding transcriptional regulator YiaG
MSIEGRRSILVAWPPPQLRPKVCRAINVPSVRAIRESTGLSQKQFAQLLGVSVRTLQE